jgi:alpha-N-arabinofuranosidase
MPNISGSRATTKETLSCPSTAYGSKTISISSNSSSWTYYDTSFSSSQSYESNNLWSLTFDASAVAGSSLYFDLVQLFPVTYHERYNELRKDVAEYLEQMKPSFLRFPGGNNLEGQTIASHWKWNETIGPVHLRPGREGDWGYPNTDALGFIEYMLW